MKTVMHKGMELEVRGGVWNDIMNSWLFIEVDKIKGYVICKERDVDGGRLFALERY